MENKRYDYSPIVRRAPLRWPNGARLALMVCPNVEFFHIDKPIPGAASAHVPDVTAYALRDYGSRVGLFRMVDVLEKHGVRATVLLNSDVCEHQPAIIEEGIKRNWEWLGHAMTNNLRMQDYPREEERAVIGRVRETITKATGTAPRGWLGPGGGDETFDTLDHLASEGFDYTLDWGCDDQPVPMRVKSGRMIAVPYQQGINDIRTLLRKYHSGRLSAHGLRSIRHAVRRGRNHRQGDDHTASPVRHRTAVPH